MWYVQSEYSSTVVLLYAYIRSCVHAVCVLCVSPPAQPPPPDSSQHSGPEPGGGGGDEKGLEPKRDSFGFGLSHHYAECYPGYD